MLGCAYHSCCLRHCLYSRFCSNIPQSNLSVGSKVLKLAWSQQSGSRRSCRAAFDLLTRRSKILHCSYDTPLWGNKPYVVCHGIIANPSCSKAESRPASCFRMRKRVTQRSDPATLCCQDWSNRQKMLRLYSILAGSPALHANLPMRKPEMSPSA